MRRLLRGLVAILFATILGPAFAQAPTPTITAVVDAASVDNEVSILVTNANALSSLRNVSVAVASRLRHVENVRIEPARIAALGPNASKEVTVTFDIAVDVPDAGAREAVVIAVDAAEGMLDHPRLTLNLGIETPETSFAIVPFVVGQSAAEGERTMSRSSLRADVERLERPKDPSLYDTVAAQSVAAGSIVEVGSSITLSAFPTGLVTVPKVAGLTVEDATRAVADAGLDPDLAPMGDAPSAELANRVDRSQPQAGATVEPGTPVSLLAYGNFTPPPEETDVGGNGGPAIARGGWDRPWRGTIRLALIVADGKETDLDSALDNFDKEPEPPKPAGSSQTGALGAAAGAMAGAGAAVSGAAADAIGEAMGEGIKAFFRMLQNGVPLSLSFVAEQGGYRVTVPGATAFTQKFGKQIAGIVPLLLPEGGTLLKATKSASSSNNTQNQQATFEIRASPDWDKLEAIVTIEMSRTFASGRRRSLSLELAGTLEPGLYPAEKLEADFNALLARSLPQ